MTRKEMYDYIVSHNLQEYVKKECGRPYTNVTNEELEEIVTEQQEIGEFIDGETTDDGINVYVFEKDVAARSAIKEICERLGYLDIVEHM